MSAKPAQACELDAVESIEAELGRGPVLECLRHGRWTFNYPSGDRAAQGRYTHGLRQGPWVFYAADGSKLAEGIYVDDQPSGTWRWYRNGVVTRRTTYEATDEADDLEND